mmetsp:Transcript_26653/g.72043  ORF Transcript_26653/g.72043 Transcript_26653/m.72043 type:complete len:265 (+) Transcript_26653:2406-3200(+)
MLQEGQNMPCQPQIIFYYRVASRAVACCHKLFMYVPSALRYFCVPPCTFGCFRGACAVSDLLTKDARRTCASTSAFCILAKCSPCCPKFSSCRLDLSSCCLTYSSCRLKSSSCCLKYSCSALISISTLCSSSLCRDSSAAAATLAMNKLPFSSSGFASTGWHTLSLASLQAVSCRSLSAFCCASACSSRAIITSCFSIELHDSNAACSLRSALRACATSAAWTRSNASWRLTSSISARASPCASAVIAPCCACNRCCNSCARAR